MSNKTLTAFLILMVSVVANAGGWSGEAKVLEIYPSSSNSGILVRHESMPNPDNCPSPTYYILDKNQMFFSEMYSLIMSSQARGSNINLHVNSCAGFNNAHPSITLVIAK